MEPAGNPGILFSLWPMNVLFYLNMIWSESKPISNFLKMNKVPMTKIVVRFSYAQRCLRTFISKYYSENGLCAIVVATLMAIGPQLAHQQDFISLLMSSLKFLKLINNSSIYNKGNHDNHHGGLEI